VYIKLFQPADLVLFTTVWSLFMCTGYWWLLTC